MQSVEGGRIMRPLSAGLWVVVAVERDAYSGSWLFIPSQRYLDLIKIHNESNQPLSTNWRLNMIRLRQVQL
jgi:hypothetical protein